MHKVQMHAVVIRKLLYGFRVSTGDNPLAKACGLSTRTDTVTIQYLTQISKADSCKNMIKSTQKVVAAEL